MSKKNDLQERFEAIQKQTEWMIKKLEQMHELMLELSQVETLYLSKKAELREKT